MSRTDDISTMKGESLNSCPKNMFFEVLDNYFNFREFWHEDDFLGIWGGEGNGLVRCHGASTYGGKVSCCSRFLVGAGNGLGSLES